MFKACSTDEKISGLPDLFKLGLCKGHHEVCDAHILHSISLLSQHIKPSNLCLSSRDIFSSSLVDIIYF